MYSQSIHVEGLYHRLVRAKITKLVAERVRFYNGLNGQGIANQPDSYKHR